MITIEFKSSPDTDILRSYDYAFDSISLGSGNQSNLIISDSNISPLHLKLEVIDNRLFIKGLNNHYKVNGKKVSGDKFCSIGDELEIGETLFKVIAFTNTQDNQEESLRSAYREIEDTRPDITLLLEALENELLKLQVQENRKKASR